MRNSNAATKRLMAVIAVVGIFSCTMSAATAGLATTNLALFDGFGPDAGRWRGSVSIDVAPISPGAGFMDEVEAVVEWAAFAPGRFQLYLDAIHPGAVDPSAADEIVYAYEVVSVTAAVPGISTLTVRVDAADARGSVAPTFVPLTGGQVPSGSTDQSTSMAWFFDPAAGLLGAGGKSPILVFTSPNGPQLDRMQLSSGLASPSPSPLVASIGGQLFVGEIPEPASLALLAMGATMLLASRRLRR